MEDLAGLLQGRLLMGGGLGMDIGERGAGETEEVAITIDMSWLLVNLLCLCRCKVSEWHPRSYYVDRK